MAKVAEQEPSVIAASSGRRIAAAEALADYEIAYVSREASLVGRREVMSGKAKFGIFGDGKEIPQVAMARAWQHGDIRAGYYRDQTLHFALGMSGLKEFFAQLYANTNPAEEPASAGRQMNCHFATRWLDDVGEWLDLTTRFNTTADVSPTGSQMPRLVGLAYASRLYRQLPGLKGLRGFSQNGNEVAWGMVGNATCAEGMFWESLNAVGVLGGPLVLSIWDDEYGISVPNRFQVAGGDLSTLLSGFQRRKPANGPHHSAVGEGFEIRRVHGWDYVALRKAYEEAANLARAEHVPTIIHVSELTQPQGHSTSGSQEQYKSPERLDWEGEWDGLRRMRMWLLAEGLATQDHLNHVEEAGRRRVEADREAAWTNFAAPVLEERNVAVGLLDSLAGESADAGVAAARDRLAGIEEPMRRHTAEVVHAALVGARGLNARAREPLAEWFRAQRAANRSRYGAHLYNDGSGSAVAVTGEAPVYADDASLVMGFEVVNACFDAMLARDPRVVAFGEDVGRIGDVNQGFRGLQDKYGADRVTDTGIRETTIIGQAIGMAMRGLRPIAEIQYLDYILYALQILSDDLATLRWRSAGGQKAPVIVRTRGHRLEGIWHSGSPMAGIINLVRGMHVLVPRDMTRAAGFYNTLLEGDEPALVVEVLNGYRVREPVPLNIGTVKTPLGLAEVLRAGSDVTLVTYGACCRIATAAASNLAEVGVDTEVIDVQSLLPFDLTGVIGRSLEKTGRIVFLDEDFPGGTTAYMHQQVLEGQNGYRWLDSQPKTLSAAAHRPAYGTDGDYFSKPSVETVFDSVYALMNEANPRHYPAHGL